MDKSRCSYLSVNGKTANFEQMCDGKPATPHGFCMEHAGMIAARVAEKGGDEAVERFYAGASAHEAVNAAPV